MELLCTRRMVGWLCAQAGWQMLFSGFGSKLPLGGSVLNRLRLQQFSADDWASVSDCYLCPKPQDHSCPSLRIAKNLQPLWQPIFKYVFNFADTKERPLVQIPSPSKLRRGLRQDLPLCR